jgi:threonine/homoserine/homoserine lactone efflux protein
MDLWLTLIPLAVASALVPIQIIVTILLLRSAAGRSTAVAWVAGMITLRLVQGVVFGLILGSHDAAPSGSDDGPGLITSTILFVLAIVFYIVAARQWLHEPDEDAPPPKWMAMVETITPGRAYLMGMGLLAIGPKFWVFTLAAIAAIGDAQLGLPASIVTFLVFVVLASGIQLLIIGIAYAVPDRADATLDRISEALTRYSGAIVITLGLVFGTWFLVKALTGFGII